MITRDVLLGYAEKRDRVKELIDEHFTEIFTEKNKIQAEYAVSTGKYIEYTDRLIEFYEDRLRGFRSSAMSLFINLKSLQKILENYEIDSVFNEEKAEKWLVNAIIMWKIHKWEFDGMKFTRGDEVKYKHEILK